MDLAFVFFEECASRENRQSMRAFGKANPNVATPTRFTFTRLTPQTPLCWRLFCCGFYPQSARPIGVMNYSSFDDGKIGLSMI